MNAPVFSLSTPFLHSNSSFRPPDTTFLRTSETTQLSPATNISNILGLCSIPTEQLCSNGRNRVRPELRSHLCRTANRSAIRIPNQPNHTDQPGIAAKRFLCTDRHLCRSGLNRSSRRIPQSARSVQSPAEQADVGKRHAWISTGEQRTAALTQL